MSDNAQQEKKSNTALSGWRFGLLMIMAGLIGKFFGLVGCAIFLAIWWTVEWLWWKKK